MPWELSDDVEVYAENVWDLLAAHPAENTLALTAIGNRIGGWFPAGDPPLFGWWTPPGEQRAAGAFGWTPPYDAVLAAAPPESLPELVAVLRARQVELPRLEGEHGPVEAFATAWTADRPLSTVVVHRLRLYAADEVAPPDPAPPGAARPAAVDDVGLVLAWVEAFRRDSGATSPLSEEMLHAQIEAGWVWLWEDPVGVPVALASHTRVSEGVARVGRVYTPQERRRHGYGGSVTAACTVGAMAAGARRVVLFADLANPTSNVLYQRLGYRPVRDQLVVRFDPS